MSTLTTKRLVFVLRKVPERRFRIMDLAPQLVDAEGNVDIARAIEHQGELNLAIAEVQTYVRGVKAAANALQFANGHTVKGRDWGYEDDEE